MIDRRTPFVCFLTDNEAHNLLLLRYWSVGSTGKWREEVKTLLSDSGLSSYAMTDMVKSACQTYVLHHRCCVCGKPLEISVRSNYSTVTGRSFNWGKPGSRERCAICAAALRASNRLVNSSATEQNRGRTGGGEKRLHDKARSVNYAGLDYVQSCFLISLLMAANAGPDNCVFTLNDSLAAKLAPTLESADSICTRLYEEGILLPVRSAASHSYNLNREAGTVTITARARVWTLADDTARRSVKEISSLLVARVVQAEPEAARVLWYVVAENECKRYLMTQAKRYQFMLSEDCLLKVAAAIRHYLDRYSIGQMWNIIYYVLKDLAALAQEGNHARQHIYNMIPGNVRRSADYRLANDKSVHPWRRPRSASESRLTSVFFDLVLRGDDTGFETLNGSNIVAHVRGLPEWR